MNFKHTYSSVKFLVFETLFLVIIPLVALQFYPHLYQFRIIAMFLGLLYLYLISRTISFSPQEIGITRLNLRSAIINILPVSIGISVLILIAASVNPSVFKIDEIAADSIRWNPWVLFISYPLVSVPLQELIFRGFYLRRLELITHNEKFLILFSATFFSLIHVPFSNKLLMVGTFIAGVWWAKHYLKYRNIFSLILSHAIIGSTLISISLFNLFTA